MHEAVFKNGFGDDTGTFGHTRQRHELGLHVGGETGEGLRDGVKALYMAVGLHAYAAVFHRDDATRLGECIQRGLHVVGPGTFKEQVPAGHQGGDRVGTRFDAVRHHRVGAAVQLLDALNRDGLMPRAANARAHGIEAFG